MHIQSYNYITNIHIKSIQQYSIITSKLINENNLSGKLLAIIISSERTFHYIDVLLQNVS